MKRFSKTLNGIFIEILAQSYQTIPSFRNIGHINIAETV